MVKAIRRENESVSSRRNCATFVRRRLRDTRGGGHLPSISRNTKRKMGKGNELFRSSVRPVPLDAFCTCFSGYLPYFLVFSSFSK